MNQAFGGAFLIKIALIFLSIYILVLGFAINYAKVFTMKNKIITLIEQYEGYSDDDGEKSIFRDIETKAKSLNYKGVTDVSKINTEDCINLANREKYCIIQYKAPNYTYYKVITYIQFDIPIVTEISAAIIPVTGETRYIYNFN